MTHLEPPLVVERGWRRSGGWSEVWSFRSLLWQLARRDLSSKYKQSLLGLGWTVVHPLVTMVVLSTVFGRFAKMPAAGGTPYPLLVFAGLLGWQILASGAGRSAGALVRNKSLIKKLYFPRVILILQTQLVVLVDFSLALLVFGVLALFYGAVPDWRVFTLPIFVLLALATSFGCGLWLSVLHATHRDVGQLVPYLLQMGMFLSPVGFSTAIVPDRWVLAYSLNPMVGVLDGFRWALLGGPTELRLTSLLSSAMVALLLTASGITFFRAREGTLADVL